MYKVRVPTIVKLILKSLIIPIIVILCLNFFNLFNYITFVPIEYQYDVGLTVYLAVAEAIYTLIKKQIEQKQAIVRCIFYSTDVDKNIKTDPSIVCADATDGVASIRCHIELKGNLKRLRKCNINLNLPEWLSSQANASDMILNYSENQLNWEFENLLPKYGDGEQKAEYNSKISFIRSTENSNLSITLKPHMNKCFGVKFETNCIKVQNGV